MARPVLYLQAGDLSSCRTQRPIKRVLHSLLCPDPFLLEILYAVFLICLVSSPVSRKSRFFVF